MSENRTVQPIIGEAPAFLEMLEHVSRATPLSKPVLVVGERGTERFTPSQSGHVTSNASLGASSARTEQLLERIERALTSGAVRAVVGDGTMHAIALNTERQRQRGELQAAR